MGLEADDGRPETSPPLRRGVQTADRAVVRERQAIPGDQGRARHRASTPRRWVQGIRDSGSTRAADNRTPGGTSRSGRGGATGGWRWRWTFQDKRRRYSHEGRRDRANTARCPISARCGIPGVPRSTYYWMTGHPGRSAWIRSPATCARSGATAANATAPGRSRPPWKGGASLASRRRIGNIIREQGMTGACARAERSEPHGTGPRGRAREPAGPRVRRPRPHTHPAGDLAYVRVGGDWATVSAGRPGGQGHRRPFRRADPGREPSMGAFAALGFPPADVRNRGLPAAEKVTGPSSRILTLGDNSMHADRVRETERINDAFLRKVVISTRQSSHAWNAMKWFVVSDGWSSRMDAPNGLRTDFETACRSRRARESTVGERERRRRRRMSTTSTRTATWKLVR